VAAAIVLTATACPAENGNWIAVVAPGLREAFQPLVEQRKAEGWEVTVIQALPDPAPAMQQIAALAAKGQPCCVVLAGDFSGEAGECTVPQGKGVHLRMNGRPTDLPWSACAEGLPVEVGRLPARNADEARVMTRKILSWSKTDLARHASPSARLLAGHHGAPPAFEKMAGGLTNVLSQRLIGRLPPAWRLEAAVHVDGSLWQVSGTDITSAAKQMMSAPVTLLAYMGHSGPDAAVSKTAALLSVSDWHSLPADGPRPGLFFTCGCFSCELDAKHESYGMAAMRAPGGPPAVIGSHGESWAAMGYLAMSGLIGSLSADPLPVRLGSLWLGVQQGLANGEISATEFALFDMADGTQGKVPLEQQRLEHMGMWMLLGDPAMRLLPPPAEIKIDPPPTPEAGKPLTVTGTVPDKLSGAALRITFERHPGTARRDLPSVPPDGPKRLTAARERRRLSNDAVLASVETKAAGTKFSATLALPAGLPDKPWTLRVETADDTVAAGVLQVN